MSIDVLGSRAGWIALLCSAAVLAGSPAFAEPESAAPAAATSPSAPETNPAPAPSSVGNADATKTEASPSGATVKVIELPSSADKTPEAAKPTEPPKDAAAAPAQEATKPAATAATTPGASDAVLDAVRRKLADKSFAGRQDGDDIAALAAFYGFGSAIVWTSNSGFSEKATTVIAELKKADDWGLDAKAFVVPELAASASPDTQADAEVSLSLAALKYARHARGGRVEPVSLSNILDMKPPLKDPKAVMSELADSASPDSYLRGLNPKHAEFEKLRQALLKARGPQQPEDKLDDALKIKLPDEGSAFKLGNTHGEIALLRKRLKVEAASSSEDFLFDAKLEAALKSFQEAHDLKANGVLTSKTRAALNREGQPKKVDHKGRVDLILVNMERWRWLPEDLSAFYVINNIPEFASRVMKGGEEVLKQKIIVGQPTWPTPVLTSSMEFVIFHPEWGVPDGIKVKELLPRLKRASAQYGGGFLEELFSGGSAGAGGRVLQAYKLTPTLNGHPVDANQIDWNKVDIKRFSFVQPAGAENPLGIVKFRFPNRHDVYMHDTPQRGLFAQSFRALSHGCMRLENPKRLAEVLLGEDKGWGPDKIRDLLSGAAAPNEVTLSKPIPVYLTYFTARVGPDDKLETYSDIYGHDERLLSALAGRPVKYNPPDHSREDFVAAGEPVGDPVVQSGKKGKKSAAGATGYTKKASGETAADFIGNAFNGLLAN